MKEDEFKPTPNTFYRAKSMTGDTGVDAIHKDLYDGKRPYATIGGSKQSGIYLATSEIAPLPYYGSAELSEMHFGFTAKSVSGAKISVPKLSIFKIADGVSVTAGSIEMNRNLSLSGSKKQLTVFASAPNYERPMIQENFDGLNKGFQDNFYQEQVVKRRLATPHYILASDLYSLYSDKGVFAYDGASLTEFRKRCAQHGGTYDKSADFWPGGDSGYSDWGNAVVELQQREDGLYESVPKLLEDSYITQVVTVITPVFLTGDDYDKPGFTLDDWYNYGAYPAVIMDGSDGYFKSTDSLTETEMGEQGRITTKNSIFTAVASSLQINGPKVSSVEDTGDSEVVYAYSDVFFSEPEAADSSCLFSSLWENWTPTNTAALTQNPGGANPLGFSDSWSPYLQETFTSIDGIPAPSYIDLGNARPDLGEYWPIYPNTVPEIEISLNIEQMLPTAFVNVSASTVLSGSLGKDAISLARSFNIFFSDKAYDVSRPLLKNMHRAYWPEPTGAAFSTDYGPGVGFHFFRTGSTQQNFYCVPSAVFGGWKGDNQTTSASNLKKVVEFTEGWTEGDGRTIIPIISGGTDRIAELVASGNIVEVPSNEYFTMRIKIPISRRGIIAYFPSILNENGKMPWLKAAEYTRRKLNDYDDYVNNPTRTMMMGSFNLRPITSGGAANNQVNMPYLKDSFIPEGSISESFMDSQLNVYLDNIKLLNFNAETVNATKVPENTSGVGISIPSARFSPSFDYVTGSIANFSLSGNGPNFLSDNYYAEQNQPAPTMISIGFENFADISGAFVDKNSIALGNYFTGVPNEISKIPDGYITAALSNQGNATAGRTLGRPYASNARIWDPYVSGVAVSSSAVGNGVRISISGAGTVGGFQHKGLINLSSSAADFNYSSPARFHDLSQTENPFAKAKLMSVSEDGKVIKVDDSSVCQLPSDTTYLVWNDGMPYLNRLNRKSVKIIKREGRKIYLDETVADMLSVTGSGYSTDGWKRNQLERMWISPYKYWLYITLMNGTNASGATWGNWANKIPASSSFVSRPQMSYGSLLLTSGAGTYGSTYNESTYYDGVDANEWLLDYTDKDGTLEMRTDYGFGQANFTSDGALESIGGQIGDDFVYLGRNLFNLTKYAKTVNPPPGKPFNIGMFPKPAAQHGTYSVKIHTTSGSEGEYPILLTGYMDKLVQINNLIATPTVNTLNESFNMYQLQDTNANNILYNWQESDNEDVLYRQLIVDTRGIKDKYHRAVDYWPLNEPNDTVYGYDYSGNATTKYLMSYANVGTTNYARVASLEGFCGWGSLFQNGQTQGFYLSGANAVSGTSYLDEWTVITHAVPGGNWAGVTWNSGTATNVNMLQHYGVMNVSIQGPRANNSRPYVYVGAVPTNDAGAIAGPMTTYLKSKTAVDWDGQQPLAIAVTFNKRLPRDNMKLYINGKLEDTSGTDWVQNTVVGASGTTMRKKPLIGLNMHGLLEEIIIYEKEMYFPKDPNQFVLDATHLPDVSGSSSFNPENVYQSRLFVMDHHNIRGSSPREVARSNTTQWKVTGL
jgi:hypothetical protein